MKAIYRLLPAILAVLSLPAASPAAAIEIASHKDRLFRLPAVLEQADGGAFRVVDYREMRDINGRDQIPERRVKRNYVDLSVRRQSRMRTFSGGGRSIEIGEAGSMENARFAVIFIHGRSGDRRLGMNDFRFGGNFNRLKNLVVKSGGVYLAPSVRSFDDHGLDDVEALIDGFRSRAGNAPVVLACGSMGSIICLSLARDEAAAAKLAGVVLLGGMPDPGLAGSPLVARQVPIAFVHGSNDSVYDWRAQKKVFDAIRARQPGYPASFVLLNTGSHGSPIRMIDWKPVLAGMLAPY